jgi:nuclear pore complex protein Nup53
LYVIVFGYPPDKHAATLEYIKSFAGEGETTEDTPHMQITNCFKVGFKNPGDALRAVRKNGEVLEGTWLVGVKWAVSRIIT